MRVIFVYGTLMRGYGNWAWCLKDRAKFVGPAQTMPNDNFALLNLGSFPGMVDGQALTGHNGVVRGELFAFNHEEHPEILKDLDRLEGHPGMYTRTPISVIFDGTRVNAETYIYQHGRIMPPCPVVESGNWRDARAPRSLHV